MEHLGYVIAITSMIVVLFIVTNIYWDSKNNKIYKRFERLLEVAEISHRNVMEERLREVERAIDEMRREIKSAKVTGGLQTRLEEGAQVRRDSTKGDEDRETMVVFGREPKEEPSP
jgi:Flp pilus assembly protein TadB